MHPTEAQLHEYVDNALAGADRDRIERHLAACAECRQLVEDLRELKRQVASLRPLTPPAATWGRIERAIRREQVSAPARRAIGLPWQNRKAAPYWLAAAAVLLVAAALSVRLLRPAPSPSAPAAASGDAREIATTVQSELEQAVDHYQKAISGLEQIKNAEKGALDPQTAATFEKSLATVDQAISESRAALKAQPNSEPAQASLLESFKTKISLLEDTVALINEMRKGNDAGAARIVSGIKQKS